MHPRRDPMAKVLPIGHAGVHQYFPHNMVTIYFTIYFSYMQTVCTHRRKSQPVKLGSSNSNSAVQCRSPLNVTPLGHLLYGVFGDFVQDYFSFLGGILELFQAYFGSILGLLCGYLVDILGVLFGIFWYFLVLFYTVWYFFFVFFVPFGNFWSYWVLLSTFWFLLILLLYI